MQKLNTIYNGDSLSILKTFDNECIDTIITSPPYYGLRNYGVEGQLGLEKTPQVFISKLMEIMNECKRVLKKTGSCWVNIGDTYGTISGNATSCLKGSKKQYGNFKYFKDIVTNQDYKKTLIHKSLVGIPERFVIAMTDIGGWVRRNTVIWHKSNCMPSSAKDRFTVDFEYFYFFTKSPKYYFETQYEPSKNPEDDIRRWLKNKQYSNTKNNNRYFETSQHNNKQTEKQLIEQYSKGRFKRCVWSINTIPFKGSHFAVFPEKLIETPIKACCPENGIVLDPFCGAGTTCLVTKKLGRNYIGIELNKEYIDIANVRINSI